MSKLIKFYFVLFVSSISFVQAANICNDYNISSVEVNGIKCTRKNAGLFSFEDYDDNTIELTVTLGELSANGLALTMTGADMTIRAESPLVYVPASLSFPSTSYDTSTKVSDHLTILGETYKTTTAKYVWNQDSNISFGNYSPVIYLSKILPLTFEDDWELRHDKKSHTSQVLAHYKQGEHDAQPLLLHEFVHTPSSTLENQTYYCDDQDMLSVARVTYTLGQSDWRAANEKEDFRYQCIERSLPVGKVLNPQQSGYLRLISPGNSQPSKHLCIHSDGICSLTYTAERSYRPLILQESQNTNPTFRRTEETITFKVLEDTGLPLLLGNLSPDGDLYAGYYSLIENIQEQTISQIWTELGGSENEFTITGLSRPFLIADMASFLLRLEDMDINKTARILDRFRPTGDSHYVQTIRVQISNLDERDQKTVTGKLLSFKNVLNRLGNEYQYDVDTLAFDDEATLNNTRLLDLKALGWTQNIKAKKLSLENSNFEDVIAYWETLEGLKPKIITFADDCDIVSHLPALRRLIGENNTLEDLTINLDSFTETDTEDARELIRLLSNKNQLKIVRSKSFRSTQPAIHAADSSHYSKLFKKLKDLEVLIYPYVSDTFTLARLIDENKAKLWRLEFNNAGPFTDCNNYNVRKIINAVKNMPKLRILNAMKIDFSNKQTVKLCAELCNKTELTDVKMSLPHYCLGTYQEAICETPEAYSKFGVMGGLFHTALLLCPVTPVILVAHDICAGSQNDDFNNARNYLARIRSLEYLTLHIANNRQYEEWNTKQIEKYREDKGYIPLRHLKIV